MKEVLELEMLFELPLSQPPVLLEDELELVEDELELPVSQPPSAEPNTNNKIRIKQKNLFRSKTVKTKRLFVIDSLYSEIIECIEVLWPSATVLICLKPIHRQVLL